MATVTSLGFSIFSRYDGRGTREARRDIRDLSNDIYTLQGRTKALVQSTALLGPGLIPLVGGLGDAFANTATAVGAATAATALYGAAAGSELKKVHERYKEVVAAENALRKATTDKAKQTALQHLSDAYEDLTAAQATGVMATREASHAWSQFTKQIQPNVMNTYATAVGTFKVALETLSPALVPISNQFQSIGLELDAMVKGQGFKTFSQWVEREGPVAIAATWEATKNLGRGIANLAAIQERFGGQDAFINWVLKTTDAFERWSGSGSAMEMRQWMRDMAPATAEFTKELMSATASLTKSLAPAGNIVVKTLSAMLEGVATLTSAFPGLITFFWGLYAANKAVQVALLATRLAVNGLTASFRTLIAAAPHLALFAAAAGVTSLNYEMQRAKVPADQLYNSLVNLGRTGDWSGSLNEQFKSVSMFGSMGKKSMEEFGLEAAKLAGVGAGGLKIATAVEDFVGKVPGVTSSTEVARQNFQALDAQLYKLAQTNKVQATQAFNQLAAAAQKQGVNINQLTALLPRYAGAVGLGRSAVEQLRQRVLANNVAMMAQANQFANNEQQAITFRNALDQASNSLGRNGNSLSLNSAKGRENRQSILNVASAIREHINQLTRDNQMTEANRQKLIGQKEQLIQLIQKFGWSRDRAKAYADVLVQIPEKVNSNITVNAEGSYKLPTGKGSPMLRAGGGLAYAGGGHTGSGRVYGPGTDRSDSIPASLSRGEFVVNAKSTRRHLPLLRSINDEGNRGTPYQGAYAGGGHVYKFAGGGGWDLGSKSPEVNFPPHTKKTTEAYNAMVGAALSAMAKDFAARMMMGGQGQAADVIREARSYVGKIPGSQGSDYSNTFTRSFGMDGQPWCAMFISEVFRRAGAGKAIPRSAAVASFTRLPTRKGPPQPGDLGLYGNPSQGGGGSHINLYIGGNKTIGGNESDAVRMTTGRIGSATVVKVPNYAKTGGMGLPAGIGGMGRAYATSFGGPDEPQPMANGTHSMTRSMAVSTNNYPLGTTFAIKGPAGSGTATQMDYGPAMWVQRRHGGTQLIDFAYHAAKHFLGGYPVNTNVSYKVLRNPGGRTWRSMGGSAAGGLVMAGGGITSMADLNRDQLRKQDMGWGRKNDMGYYKDGGRMSPGEVAVVGEAGPELFRAGGGGGTVIPNAAGMGVTLVINGNVYVKSEREFRQMVVSAIDEAKRKKQL